MKFWQLIETSRSGIGEESQQSCEQQAENLKRLLMELTASEVLEFERIFVDLFARAYRYDLWAACIIINDRTSDIAFGFFRWWLIGQGRDYYERALHDVERAGDNVQKGEIARCDEIALVIEAVYREKTGQGFPKPLREQIPTKPAGKRFKNKDLPTLYPRLWQKFG